MRREHCRVLSEWFVNSVTISADRCHLLQTLSAAFTQQTLRLASTFRPVQTSFLLRILLIMVVLNYAVKLFFKSVSF